MSDRKEYFKDYWLKNKLRLGEKKRKYARYYYKQHHTNKNNPYSELTTIQKHKGITRKKSSQYLFNTIKHSKLKDYEIHHCFGYEDFKCFIYIPKELHLQIHQFLRDNGISADSNHFSQIAHIINDWNGYTYIKV